MGGAHVSLDTIRMVKYPWRAGTIRPAAEPFQGGRSLIDDTGRPGRPMADYVRVIRRGWWIVLATLVIVTAVTYFISSRQAPLFQAQRDDLISAQDITNPRTSKVVRPAPPAVHRDAWRRSLRASRSRPRALELVPDITNMTPRKLLKASTVTADPIATDRRVQGRLPHQAGAVALANAYAQAFAAYSKQQTNTQIDAQDPDDQDRPRSFRASSDRSPTRSRRSTRVNNRDGAPRRLHPPEPHSGQAWTSRTNDHRSTAADATRPRSRSRARRPAPQQLAPNTKRNTAIGVILGLVHRHRPRVRARGVRHSNPLSRAGRHPSSASRCSAACRGPTRTCESTTS